MKNTMTFLRNSYATLIYILKCNDQSGLQGVEWVSMWSNGCCKDVDKLRYQRFPSAV